MTKRITEDMLAQARWMRSRGESWDSIASTLGVLRQGLCRILERGQTKATEMKAARERVRARRREGDSWAVIAREENMTLAQVRYAGRKRK